MRFTDDSDCYIDHPHTFVCEYADLGQALDLGESEEEELEDIVEDFASQANMQTVRCLPRSELHLVEVFDLGRRHAGGKAISFPVPYSVSHILFHNENRLRSNT